VLLQVMKALGHENIVKFYTVFHEKSASYLALEFIGGGGLNSHLSHALFDDKSRLSGPPDKRKLR
jgi:serine/threonine protein kinase